MRIVIFSTEGKIALQAEGTEVEFRKVSLTGLGEQAGRLASDNIPGALRRLTSTSCSQPDSDSRRFSWFANSLLRQPDHSDRRLEASQAASSLSS
jgi:hypothetical protein